MEIINLDITETIYIECNNGDKYEKSYGDWYSIDTHSPYESIISNKTKIEELDQLVEEYRETLLRASHVFYTKDAFVNVINKLPHSQGRVPFTYHHDYLREHSIKFGGKSRSDVASQHDSSNTELYAVCLAKIIEDLNFISAENLDSSDFLVCKEAIKISKEVIKRIDNV